MKLVTLIYIVTVVVASVVSDDAKDKKEYTEGLASLWSDKELVSVVAFVAQHKNLIDPADYAEFMKDADGALSLRKGLLALPKDPSPDDLDKFDTLFKALEVLRKRAAVLFMKYDAIFSHKDMGDAKKEMQ